jgi:signal transduction histidine kinase
MLELEGVKKDGSKFPMEISLSTWKLQQSIFFASIIRDLTDRKKADAEKQALELLLQQAQKMETIGTFAGGIAHDFNNILSPIVGFTEMSLESVSKGSDLHENLYEVLTASLRAKALVQQILTFSRQTEKELKPLKLQMIIKKILQLIRASLSSTITIKQSIVDNCGTVLADKAHIHQIVMNLMTNAYHAMEAEGGTLTIRLSEVKITSEDLKNFNLQPGTFVCFSVSDTGHGIENHLFDRIFEPYFTTKIINKGTGLGLSVVHGIVNSYNGDIRVYSESGKGASFNVYLPVMDSKQGESGIIPKDNLHVSGGGEHILLVDDEESILKMEKLILERLWIPGDNTNKQCGSVGSVSLVFG